MSVDLTQYSNALASAIEETRSDFEDRLKDLQKVVQSIGWTSVNPNILIDEIGEITFSSFNSASDLIESIDFTPIPEQTLLDYDVERIRTHVFESQSLEDAENKIVSIIAGADNDVLKTLNGVTIPAAMQDILINGQEKNDFSEHSQNRALLQLYPSVDNVANLNWLDEQYDRKRADRDKDIFVDLFEKAQKSIQWAYSQGIRIEKMHADFTIQYCNLFTNTTQAAIAAYRADVLANIAQFESDLEQAEKLVDVNSLEFKRESAEKSLRIDQANDRTGQYVRNYSSKLNTNIKMLDSRVQGGKNVADGYKAIFTSYGGYFQGISFETTSGD